MISETVVGPQLGQDGSQVRQRASKDGATVVMDAHARYQEAVSRGGVWALSTTVAGVVTLAAANVSPLPANTGAPIAGVFNPVNSGYNLVVLLAQLLQISGTPAGPIVWNIIAPNAGITAAGGNGAINCASYVTGGSIAKTFLNSALTGSAAGVLLRPLGGNSTTAIGAGIASITEETAGSVVVPPGGFAGLAAWGAGTSHIVGGSLVWEEVKL